MDLQEVYDQLNEKYGAERLERIFIARKTLAELQSVEGFGVDFAKRVVKPLRPLLGGNSLSQQEVARLHIFAHEGLKSYDTFADTKFDISKIRRHLRCDAGIFAAKLYCMTGDDWMGRHAVSDLKGSLQSGTMSREDRMYDAHTRVAMAHIEVEMLKNGRKEGVSCIVHDINCALRLLGQEKREFRQHLQKVKGAVQRTGKYPTTASLINIF